MTGVHLDQRRVDLILLEDLTKGTKIGQKGDIYEVRRQPHCEKFTLKLYRLRTRVGR